MQTYHFILWLDGVGEITDELANRVFEAGCDDAALGVFHGMRFLEFDRDDKSLTKAVTSALRDVGKANLSVKRIGLYDFVTASEIAKRTGRTRANISQLIKGDRGSGNFPSSINVTGHSPLWQWQDVSDWFADYQGEPVSDNHETELRKIDSAYQCVRQIPDKKERNRLVEELASI